MDDNVDLSSYVCFLLPISSSAKIYYVILHEDVKIGILVCNHINLVQKRTFTKPTYAIY